MIRLLAKLLFYHLYPNNWSFGPNLCKFRNKFNGTDKQKETIEHFLKTETKSIKTMEVRSPGPVRESLTYLYYAADVILYWNENMYEEEKIKCETCENCA